LWASRVFLLRDDGIYVVFAHALAPVAWAGFQTRQKKAIRRGSIVKFRRREHAVDGEQYGADRHQDQRDCDCDVAKHIGPRLTDRLNGQIVPQI
jgi:hypothetical protein